MKPERFFHLSDEQWAQIEAAFPQRRGQGGFEQKISNRLAFEAVLFRLRTGGPWSDLPRAYGDDHPLCIRWQRSSEKRRAFSAPWRPGIWRQLSVGRWISAWPCWTPRWCAPTSTPPAHEKKGSQAPGRSRGGLSTKIHTVALSESQVLGVVLAAGQAGDAPVGEAMLAAVLTREEIKAVSADRACDSNTIRGLPAAAYKEAVSPPRSNRREPPEYDRARYKERNKIERLFGRLKQFRAIAARYDKLASMSLGGVLAGLLVVNLKSIVSSP